MVNKNVFDCQNELVLDASYVNIPLRFFMIRIKVFLYLTMQ